MRKSPYAFLIAWLSTCLFCLGAGSWNGIAFTAWNGVSITAWNGTSVSVGAAASYLFTENFENTGSPGYDTATWSETATGTVDENTAVTTPGMTGSECLRISVTAQTGSTTSPTFTSADIVWCYFQFYIVGVPAATYNILQITTSAGTELLRLRATTTSKFEIRGGGGTSVNTVSTFSTGQLYNVWVYYDKTGGTASAAKTTVGFSTTSTKPTVGNDNYAESLDGTATGGAAQKVKIGGTGSYTGEFYTDRVYVDDADITTVP